MLWKVMDRPVDQGQGIPVAIAKDTDAGAVFGGIEGTDPKRPELTAHGPKTPSAGVADREWRILLRDLEVLCAGVEQAGDPSRVRTLLGRMAQRLESVPAPEAVKAIREVLKSGRDAETRLLFEVGEGGWLSGWPSYRCWLLDSLSRIDPDAAATEAAGILSARGNADEWSLALRDFSRVRQDAAGRVFLKSKVRELLSDPRWQQEQSAGWLEAFDVVVHLRATDLTRELAGLAGMRGNRPASHAASLALDRLVQAAPADVLGRFLNEPILLNGPFRASCFARADVRDPVQRGILERYMLSESSDPEERARFFGLFPNAHFAVSRNLLTPAAVVKEGEQKAQDRAALAVVNEWLGSGRFESVRPGLEGVRERLEGFLRAVDR
jgi:hypothetical protein